MFFQLFENCYLIRQRSYAHPSQTNEVLTHVLIIYLFFILLINTNEISTNIHWNYTWKCSCWTFINTSGSHPFNLWRKEALIHLIEIPYYTPQTPTRPQTPPSTHTHHSYSWHIFLCLMYGLLVFHFKLFKFLLLLTLWTSLSSSSFHSLTSHQMVNFSRAGTVL